MFGNREAIAKMWENLLGFAPEKFEETDDHRGCFNCKSLGTEPLPSPAWTGLRKCPRCNYYTYVVYQDKMGTVAPDDVACDKRYSTMNPPYRLKSKSET